MSIFMCGIGQTLIGCPRMITHDIQRFSNHLAAMYSNLAKPTLDVILYNFQLSQNVGAEGVMGLTIFVQLSAMLRQFTFRSSDMNNPHVFVSALYDPAFWHVYCTLSTNGRIFAPHTFSPCRILRGSCIHERRNHRENAHRTRICLLN